MNASIHDFAVEALKINNFLEQYLTSPSLRLSYVLGILGGEHPAGVDAQAKTIRARDNADAQAEHRDATVAKAHAKAAAQGRAAHARAAKANKYGPESNRGRGLVSKTGTAEARARYNGWTSAVPIGDIRDVDQVIMAIDDDSLFINKRSARFNVGRLLRADTKHWRAVTTPSGNPQKRWGSAAMWLRIGPLTPDLADDLSVQDTAIAQAMRRAKATARKQKQRARQNSEARA